MAGGDQAGDQHEEEVPGFVAVCGFSTSVLSLFNEFIVKLTICLTSSDFNHPFQ